MVQLPPLFADGRVSFDEQASVNWILTSNDLPTTYNLSEAMTTVFDTFPWPQFELGSSRRESAQASSGDSTRGRSPEDQSGLTSAATIAKIDTVAAAARELRRAEAVPKMKGGLCALYRTLELPGANPLKDALPLNKLDSEQRTTNMKQPSRQAAKMKNHEPRTTNHESRTIELPYRLALMITLGLTLIIPSAIKLHRLSYPPAPPPLPPAEDGLHEMLMREIVGARRVVDIHPARDIHPTFHGMANFQIARVDFTTPWGGIARTSVVCEAHWLRYSDTRPPLLIARICTMTPAVLRGDFTHE